MKINGIKTGYSLEREIAKFIKWYKKYIIKANIGCNEYYNDIYNIYSIIETISNWYTNNNVSVDLTNINDNAYSLLLDSLKFNEKKIFCNPKYCSKINFNTKLIRYDFKKKERKREFITLSNDGYITATDSSKLKLVGNKINDIIDKLNFKERLQVEAELARISLTSESTNLLLNTIMYRIIEKDKHLGAKRALKFAIEFYLDMDIPLVYGINLENPDTINLIEEYFKHGGNRDLNCLINYPLRKNDFEVLKYANIEDILKYLKEKYYKKENDEEKSLVIKFKH